MQTYFSDKMPPPKKKIKIKKRKKWALAAPSHWLECL